MTELDVAEPYNGADRSITFTVKLANLGQLPTPQPNSIWKVSWTSKDAAGASKIFFVTFDTTLVPTGAFNYGYTDETTSPPTDTTQCGLLSCPPVTGAVDAAHNAIVIRLDTAAPLSYDPATGSTLQAFTASFGAGTALSSLAAGTQLLVGGVGTGLLETADSMVKTSYTVKGNLFCAPNSAPIAVLTATPTSGKAPLTVAFDASRSNDPDAGVDTIASYTFDFGDGSAPVTQSAPQVSHTYANAGTYIAKVEVTDSRGKTSVSPAQVTIAVKGKKK